MKCLFIVTVSLFMLSACSSSSGNSMQKVTMRTPGAQSAKCTIENAAMRYVIYTNETLKIMKTPHDLDVTCVSEDNVRRSAKIARVPDRLAFKNVRDDIVSGLKHGHGSNSIFKYPKNLTVSFLDVEKVDSEGLAIVPTNNNMGAKSSMQASASAGYAGMDKMESNIQQVVSIVNVEPPKVEEKIKVPVIKVGRTNLHSLYNPSSSYVIHRGK